MPSEDGRAITRRRALWTLGGVTAASAGWWFFGDATATPPHADYEPVFCPSESELEEMAWVRGWFPVASRTVTPGERFTSTIKLVNRGGEPATYQDFISLVDLVDGETDLTVDQDVVEVRVTADGETTADVSMVPPESFTGGYLRAPRLASSCDTVSDALQKVEVSNGGA